MRDTGTCGWQDPFVDIMFHSSVPCCSNCKICWPDYHTSSISRYSRKNRESYILTDQRLMVTKSLRHFGNVANIQSCIMMIEQLVLSVSMHASVLYV